MAVGDVAQSHCILFNKQESVTSDIGGNLTEVGTVTRSAAKFNNGGYSDSISNYLTIADGNMLRTFDPNQFAIEFALYYRISL